MPKDIKKENKHFFKDFKGELKKVIWPTPKQLANNTVAVISIVLITAIIVFILDITFEKLNTNGVNKLKELVSSNNEITNQITNEIVENEENAKNSEDNNEQTRTSEEVAQ